MRTGRGPDRGQGRRGGRRGGHGGGRNNTTQYEDFEEPTEEQNGVDMLDSNRKRANNTVQTEGNSGTEQIVGDPKTNQLAIIPQATSVMSPLPKRDPKRSKANSDGNDTAMAAKNLAGSQDGRRWAH